MDTPLMALQELFGDKKGLIRYVFLICKYISFTKHSLVPSLSFSRFPVRSNSEKEKAARKFLTNNQPKPEQHLVFEFILVSS